MNRELTMQDKHFLVEDQKIEFSIRKFRGRSENYDIAVHISGPDQTDLLCYPEEMQLYRKRGF